MQSTQIPFSNEKQRVDLLTTAMLYPSGTTSGNTGQPIVYHPVSKKMSLGEFPAGESILDFSRTGSTLAITTDKTTFALDLNKKTYANRVEMLRDPGLDGTIGGADWRTTGTWTFQNSTASAVNDNEYLFQDLFLSTGGDFTIEVVVDSVAQGGFSFLVSGFNSPAISAAGTYKFDITLPPGGLRFHFHSFFGFTGVVSEVHLYQNGLLLQDAYDSGFVHKTGDESITGLKTFSTGIESQFISLSGVKGLSHNFISNNLIALTLGTFGGGVARVTYAGADHEWYLTNNGALGMRLDVGGNLHVQNQVTVGGVPVAGTITDFRGNQAPLIGNGDNLYLSGGNILFGNPVIGFNTANLDSGGNFRATAFIGDGSRLTNLPISTPKYAPEFTVSTAGAQSITVPTAGSVVLKITVLEPTGYTRPLYESRFSISGNTVTITADANLQTGDKIMILYQ